MEVEAYGQAGGGVEVFRGWRGRRRDWVGRQAGGKRRVRSGSGQRRMGRAVRARSRPGLRAIVESDSEGSREKQRWIFRQGRQAQSSGRGIRIEI